MAFGDALESRRSSEGLDLADLIRKLCKVIANTREHDADARDLRERFDEGFEIEAAALFRGNDHDHAAGLASGSTSR